MYETIPLSETTRFIVDNRGKTVPTAEHGIALIATNCITNDRLYPAYNNVRWVDAETYENWFRSHPLPGDIILTNKGSQNGAICLVPDKVDFVIAQDMVALRADEKKVDSKYLFAALRSPMAQNQIKNLDVSGVIPHFKKGDFDKLHLPFPSMDIQKAVGELYFELSFKIELNRRMNETLESIARAIFKSWFVDFDPVRAKLEGQSHEQQSSASAYPMPAEVYDLFPSAFQDSELGKIPEGWEVGPLASIAPLQTETVKPQEHKDTLWHHFSIPAFDVDKNPVVEFGSEIKSNKYAVPGSCVLLSKLNPRTPRIWIPHVDDPSTAICSTEFMPFVPKTKRHLPFVYEQIGSESLQADVLARATGSTGSRQRVKPKEIAEILVVVPKDELVDSFCDIAGPMIELTLNNQLENLNLTQLRDTLLPKLLSGELTVPDALLQAEEVI